MSNKLVAKSHSRLLDNKLFGCSLMVAAVAASQLGLFYSPQVGAYCTAGALALLMSLAALSDANRRLALSVAIIPLLSMVNLSLVHGSAFEQTAILYGSMLALALTYRLSLAPPIPADSRIGWRGYAVGLPLMVILGSLLGLLGYKLLVTSYIFGNTRLWEIAAVAITGAVAEELLLRGLIQRQAARLMRPVYAAGLASLLFAALALSHFSGWALLVGVLSTSILSTVYLIKPNVILTTALNLTSKLVYIGLMATFIFR